MTKIEAKTLLSQLEHSEGQIVSCAAFLVPNNESSAKQALNAKSITPRDFLIRISDLEALGTVLSCTLLLCHVVSYRVMFCSVIDMHYCTILHYTILHHTILYYTIPFHN